MCDILFVTGRKNVLVFIGITIVAILFLISPMIAVAEEPSCTPTNVAMATQNACEIDLAANGCQKYLENHPQLADKMRSCPSSEVQSDWSWIRSCGGGVSEMLGVLKNNSTSLWSKLINGDPEVTAKRELQERLEVLCENDSSLSIRRSLFENAWLEGSSKPMDDSQLRRVSCRTLINRVRARQNFSMVQDLADNLDSPEFKRQWQEARGNFFNSIGSEVIALANGLGVKLNCYNLQAKAEVSCSILATIAAGLIFKKMRMASATTADYIEGKVAVVYYPRAWHAEIMVDDVTYNRSFKGHRDTRPFEASRRAANQGKGGFVAFHFKVTSEELANIKKFVTENKGSSISCMGGACKPINKFTDSFIPEPLAQFPMANVIQLALKKQMQGKAGRITHIEYNVGMKDLALTPVGGLMEMFYMGVAAGAGSVAIIVTVETAEGLVDYLIPLEVQDP